MNLAPRAALLAVLALLAPLHAPVHAQPASSARFAGGAVAADHALASRAGAAMLEAGGNAVDAAVAASFTLSVVRPFSCGIGGGGFMVIHLHRHPRLSTVDVALNYREQAPAWSSPDMYEKLAAADPHASTRGGAAVAIPGTVAGLLHALETYGTLDRATVLAPALRAAREGFTADAAFHTAVHGALIPAFTKEPALQARFAFVWDRFARGGRLAVGDVITLPEQAAVLQAIADRGVEGFRDGPVGDAMVAAIARDGGRMTKADLASFRVDTLPPLETTWKGLRVVTMPPPSSGGLVLAQVFATLAARPENLTDLGHNSPATIHLIAEACKHAFADRARWLADPAFTSIPLGKLLDPAMLAARAGHIDPAGTLDPEAYGWTGNQLPADGGTSHLSVIDARGNAVACTETINLEFGSWLDGGGFCLNNEMDDFLTQRGKTNAFGLTQAEANLPAPGKRPLSSMTPTILLKPVGADQEVSMVVGASGGPRIISGTLQAILNYTCFGMTAGEAVTAWRFHHQWKPNELLLESQAGKTTGLEKSFWTRGHATTIKPEGWSVGVVQVVTRDGEGVLTAACDPRKGGVPAGVLPRP